MNLTHDEIYALVFAAGALRREAVTRDHGNFLSEALTNLPSDSVRLSPFRTVERFRDANLTVDILADRIPTVGSATFDEKRRERIIDALDMVDKLDPEMVALRRVLDETGTAIDLLRIDDFNRKWAESVVQTTSDTLHTARTVVNVLLTGAGVRGDF